MEIINKGKRPLRIPLPGGKRLHLGPGRTGQITAKAAEHPPLRKLIDEGEIEILDAGKSQGTGSSSGTGASASRGPSSSTGGVRHTGDR